MADGWDLAKGGESINWKGCRENVANPAPKGSLGCATHKSVLRNSPRIFVIFETARRYFCQQGPVGGKPHRKRPLKEYFRRPQAAGTVLLRRYSLKRNSQPQSRCAAAVNSLLRESLGRYSK